MPSSPGFLPCHAVNVCLALGFFFTGHWHNLDLHHANRLTMTSFGNVFELIKQVISAPLMNFGATPPP